MKRIFTAFSFLLIISALSVTAQNRVYTPTLVSPLNGETGLSPDVVLDWDAVTGGNTVIIYYDIHLDVTPDFTNPVEFETELVSGIQMSELKFGVTYYWRVRARDGDDISEWSDPWSFDVLNTFKLKKPNDVDDQITLVTLEWEEVTGITEYDYQFDTVYLWNDISGFTADDLFDVFVIDNANTWAVGKGGLILFFDGSSWTESESGTTNDLLSVFFIDESHGWAAGKSGTILYFENSAWSEQTSGISEDIQGLYFVNGNAGWAVAKGGEIATYNGSEWSAQTSGTTKDLFAVNFVDESHGWAAGKAGEVVFYNGTEWTGQETGSTRDMYAVAFTDINNGWAAGKAGAILQFKDGEWSTVDHGLTTKDIYALTTAAGASIWGCGKAGIMVNYNGQEWLLPTSGTTINLRGISVTGDAGMAVGEDGTMVQYTDEAFNSPMAEIFSVDGSETEYDVEKLLYNTKYFWRMRARHSNDTSSWTAPKSFITIAYPEPSEPDNGSTDNNLDVLLEWDGLADYVIYNVEIDDEPSFTEPIAFVAEINSGTSDMLTFNTLYYWRVRAAHSLDNSEWSEAWTFETIGTVYLTTPADGADDVKRSPVLEWEEITGITEYHVEISTDDSFSDLIVEETVPESSNILIVPVVLDQGAEYFWRVRAVNNLDLTDWSETWSFTTVPPVGINDLDAEALNLGIYPNPAADVLFVRMEVSESTNISLSITDLLGKELIYEEIEYSANNSLYELSIENLPEGIYLLKLDSGSSSVVRKLIVR